MLLVGLSVIVGLGTLVVGVDVQLEGRRGLCFFVHATKLGIQNCLLFFFLVFLCFLTSTPVGILCLIVSVLIRVLKAIIFHFQRNAIQISDIVWQGKGVAVCECLVVEIRSHVVGDANNESAELPKMALVAVGSLKHFELDKVAIVVIYTTDGRNADIVKAIQIDFNQVILKLFVVFIVVFSGLVIVITCIIVIGVGIRVVVVVVCVITGIVVVLIGVVVSVVIAISVLMVVVIVIDLVRTCVVVAFAISVVQVLVEVVIVAAIDWPQGHAEEQGKEKPACDRGRRGRVVSLLSCQRELHRHRLF
mmetsp:Transcript_18514/g.45866  ORF Transcript_18514/g.45866 Transcript_18514/m.45866 type:complete len:305 (-) Transcript_18514:230-1144(-)